MKSKSLFKFLLAVSLIFFSSCDNESFDDRLTENPTVTPSTFSEYFGNDISRDFMGKVVDINHNPIPNAEISIGGDTALTDNNGVFIIRDANVKERFAYVKAKKTGYIHGSRSLVPSEGTNQIQIMLLQENVISTIESGIENVVTLPNGSAVKFDGNFTKPDGSDYSGSVDVIFHHLNPADEDMRLQMPGMLYAENQDGAERMLQTFGMLAVELKGSAGEDLNLAEGSTAEITMPLDSSLLATAPQTIPLWYFDEDLGYWKEEGQAKLQGNTYVGEVSHFSFWNCDVQADASMVCVNVLSEDGQPLSNTQIVITSANYGSSYGYTNSDGVACGFVPSGETLIIEIDIYQGNCSSDFTYTENIGPFSGDDVVTINLPPFPEGSTETITGFFNACDNSPVTNGYVELRHNGLTYMENVENGAFEFSIFSCPDNSTFTLIGFDYDNLQTTGEINLTFTSPVTDIGNLIACNTVDEFANITVGNFYETTFIGNFDVISNNNFLQIFNFQGNECLNIFGAIDENNPIGTYDGLEINNPSDTGFSLNIEGCFPFDTSDNNVNYDLTSYGNPGEYIDINISGTVKDTLNATHNVNGTIHVLRDQ
jgi:hypothetical protein